MGVKEEFEAVTADIEKYLGILKGNETAWEWRESYKNDYFSHYSPPYSPVPPMFQTEPPGGEYTVFFQTLLLPDEAFVDAQHKVEFGRQVNERCATSFTNGVNWASGIADYLNSLCADIIRPDAAALQESVQLFHDSMIETQAALPVGWTEVNFESWVGGSSDACQIVVERLHAMVLDQYSLYYAHCFALYGGACALVVAAQEGLVKAMEDIRDGIKANLQAWQNLGGPPFDATPMDPQVVAIAAVARKIAGKVPGIGIAFEVGELGASILGLFGLDVGDLVTYSFDARDAETTYNEMTAMLQDAYLTPLQDGMHNLQDEKSRAIRSAQDGIYPWLPEPLAGADNEPWRHDQEHA